MDYFQLGKKLLIAFVITGLVILLIFYFTTSAEVIRLGHLYLALTVLVSWLYVAVVLFGMVRRRISVRITLQTIGLMVLNILIAVLYGYLIVLLSNYTKTGLHS